MEIKQKKKVEILLINLNRKQKILLSIIAIILIIFGGIYVYFKDYSNTNIEELEIENTSNEETDKENEEEKGKIKVHISGAVKNEGVIELEEGARLIDGIEKVGGFTEEAYTKDINLASILEDGMKIYVYSKKEMEEGNIIENNNNNILKNEIVSNQGSTTSTKNEKININKATEEELDTLPGIGEATAKKIIEYREEKGTFKNIEELKEVSGIGDAKFDKIKDLITVK